MRAFVALIAAMLVVAAPVEARERLVVRTSSHATATASKPCRGDAQIDKIAVNRRTLLFGEQASAEKARMYGHGVVVEFRSAPGARASVRVATVRRVVVVVRFHCVQRASTF